ncbi:ABC transporter ATP-binding protein [Natrinema longum]|uniref:ABC transporter ATP-binding protein n=1 Tax=Natrinema longum TaxID=370324 RepID=A0A8A2UCB1_9EURY|nr:ABC transporter ATP-binding protein [Natrinema longum]MBZ6495778.1 ABC transporter ATP-binding protein [Natrinema longum]QSW86277.1 ABC transporter ATP-binding protein [Natrinema longum]
MAAIQTTGLTKRYGESVLAVDDLDLTVENGEVFGFLGPNGAGKSTTINMLLDFVRPTHGTASVLELDVQADTDEIRHRIGVLPEGASVYDRLTAREHLQWVIDTKGADDDPDALLERVGLAGDGDRAAGGYSKGMTQRLGFGMALVGDPDLLILDEPSSGLDPTGMQEMREIITEEADRGTSVFFSSHILGEVEAICDRIGIMNEGRLVATGTPDDLQGELDLGAPITLEVEAVPDGLELERLEGVRSVSVDGTTITATCADPAVKVDVVERVASATAVRDIVSEDVSLEQLFNTYTNGEREETVPAPEVTA